MTRQLGRVTIHVEPRDVWIGVYVAPGAIYICLLPMLVIRLARPWRRRP